MLVRDNSKSEKFNTGVVSLDRDNQFVTQQGTTVKKKKDEPEG